MSACAWERDPDYWKPAREETGRERRARLAVEAFTRSAERLTDAIREATEAMRRFAEVFDALPPREP